MKENRQTKIEFEVHEKKIIRFRRNTPAAIFCQKCSQTTPHFLVGQTAQIFGLTELAVFRLAEFGRIHSTENNLGALLICGNSLSNFAEKESGKI